MPVAYLSLKYLQELKALDFQANPPFAFSLGRFDKGKSKINEIKYYPENTNVKTKYVYSNPR